MNEWQERIGVGRPHYGLGRTGPTRQRRIIAEEGSRKGRTAGIETDHADGHIDAQVFVDPLRHHLSLTKGITDEH